MFNKLAAVALHPVVSWVNVDPIRTCVYGILAVGDDINMRLIIADCHFHCFFNCLQFRVLVGLLSIFVNVEVPAMSPWFFLESFQLFGFSSKLL